MARTHIFAGVKSILTAAASGPDGAVAPPRAISRRAMMAMLGAAAACSPSEPPAQAVSTDTVAIIGGGVSALVAAWRLSNAGVTTEIFEASGRTGGRMYTLRDFSPEGQFCELGGEFIDGDHTALIKLCRELGVDLQELRAELDVRGDVFDIGGQLRTCADLLDPYTQSGPFAPVAVRIAADQAALLDAGGQWTPRAIELDELPLSTYLNSLAPSTEPWVIDLLRIAYQSEYGLPVDQQSSLNLVDSIGSTLSDPFEVHGPANARFRIAGGSSALPDALTARLAAGNRALLHLRHELRAVSRTQEGFRLTFVNETNPPVMRVFPRVLFTLPFSRLREIKGLGGLGLPADKMRVINELGYAASAKLAVGASSRASVEGVSGATGALEGVLYSDKGFEAVWDGSLGQPGSTGILCNLVTGPAARREESTVLAALERGLAAVAPGIARTLRPRQRASFFWAGHPHTKGSHSASKPGQYTGFREIAARPEMAGTLTFAGEHASIEWPGSMNGAVDAGEQAARQVLSIAA